MRTFDISIAQDAVAVKQGEEAILTFTVTNVSGRDLRALLKLVPENDDHMAWLAIDGEGRRDVENAQSDTVVVKIRPPQGAPPGIGKFRLVVASEENPDEDFAEVAAQFTVEQPPVSPARERRPRPWWIIATAAGVLVAVALIAWRFWPKPDPGYIFQSKLGSPDGIGSGEGEFHDPQGVATDTDGNVYVSEGKNNRIQKFDGKGNPVLKWGSRGIGEGQFQDPYGVATDESGNVYVADRLNNRIQKFDGKGNPVLEWGSPGTGDGQFQDPYGVATDVAGNVYVADTSNHRIGKFDKDGGHVRTWGSLGTSEGQFKDPYGVATDGAGNLYVADRGNHRIQKFDARGSFVLEWGSPGTGDGQFQDPHGVAADGDGNVFVADTGNNRIQKFDSNGRFLTKWGSFGSGDGQFSYPVGVATMVSDVYVVDNKHHRIQRFAPKPREEAD